MLTSGSYSTTNPWGWDLGSVAIIDGYCYRTYDNINPLYTMIIPERTDTVPLAVFIHGGGYVANDRNDLFDPLKNYQDKVEKLVQNGVAVVTIDYDLLKTAETEGVVRCLRHCTNAIQYFRKNAGKFNIKKNKIGLWGMSAGATTSLWIAFNKDMKKSSGPIIWQQSTRVQAVVALKPQASLNILNWQPDIFYDAEDQSGNAFLLDTDCIVNTLEVQVIQAYYGDNSSMPDWNTIVPAYMLDNDLELHLPHLVSRNDPPVWLENTGVPIQFPNNFCSPADTDNSAQLNHHPYHVRTLYDKIKDTMDYADSHGLSRKLKLICRAPLLGAPIHNFPASGYADYADFLIDILN